MATALVGSWVFYYSHVLDWPNSNGSSSTLLVFLGWPVPSDLYFAGFSLVARSLGSLLCWFFLGCPFPRISTLLAFSVKNKVLEWKAFNAEMLLKEPSEGTIQG